MLCVYSEKIPLIRSLLERSIILVPNKESMLPVKTIEFYQQNS